MSLILIILLMIFIKVFSALEIVRKIILVIFGLIVFAYIIYDLMMRGCLKFYETPKIQKRFLRGEEPHMSEYISERTIDIVEESERKRANERRQDAIRKEALAEYYKQQNN